VLDILRRMAETLVTIARELGLGEGVSAVGARVRVLRAQVSEVTEGGGLDGDDGEASALRAKGVTFPDVALDDSSASAAEGGEDGGEEVPEELMQDVQCFNDSLYGLDSVLQDPAGSAPRVLAEGQDNIQYGP